MLVFVTTGGTVVPALAPPTDLGPNTWAEIVLVLISAGLGITAVRVSGRGRAWGAASLGLFGALAAFTLLSVSWSVQPASSWLDTNLTLAYLATYAGGLALARIAPGRWGAILGAMVVASVVVSAYALLAKVFPTTIDANQTLLGARLSSPFGYWNALGLMAGLGLPACLWLGARRGESPILLRALSVPAIAALVAVILLSYSRGALLAAVVGLAWWFVLVPLRLRGALVLALGAAAGGAVMLWAIGTPGITSDGQSTQAQISAGHTFGVVLVVMLLVSFGAGLAAALATERVELSAHDRWRGGAVLLAVLACVPVAGVVGLSASSRGLTGEISRGWTLLTNSSVGSGGQTASRLLAPDNSHARYWSQGIKVGEHAMLKGVGGLGFATASLRYSGRQGAAAHAHSYLIQTFADFGLIGLAVSIALVGAWAVAVRRAVSLRRPSLRWLQSRGREGAGEPVPERAAERAGLLTLVAVVLIFGVHAAIDWTWFVPGVAVPALVCAGWLAGRGPLAEPVQRAPRREREVAPESSGPREAIAAVRRAFLAAPGQIAAVAAIAAIALLGAWTIWQPLRSANADAASLAALSGGHLAAALADARSAAAADPLSIDPLSYESSIYSALGENAAAHAALEADVALQPANPATWLQLGQYDASPNVGQPREAIAALQAELYLFPNDPATPKLIANARSQLP